MAGGSTFCRNVLDYLRIVPVFYAERTSLLLATCEAWYELGKTVK